MDYLQNLHTHSTYCDGMNTPEEILLTAIRKGFSSIGFSSHSYMKREPKEYSMTLDKEEKYRKEIDRLKEKYSGIIKVYCGLEADMYSNVNLSGYDYVIGSVHYIEKDGKLLDFDRTDGETPESNIRHIIADSFGCSGMDFVKAYYETLARLPEHGQYDVVGHFDLPVKLNDRLHFVDEESPEYLKCAIEAAEVLVDKIGLIEINTGAMARGYRKTPYPSPQILRELKQLGFGVVISSDCHIKKYLDYGFAEATALLKECGFTERFVLTDSGFRAIAI